MFLNNFFSKLFQSQNKSVCQTGDALPLEEILLPELEKYPIWIYALDNEEDYNECQDESWLKPIINSTNVTQELVEAYILLKVQENGCPAYGHLDIQKMILDDLWFWNFEGEDWDKLEKLDLPSPIHLISIPSIKGQMAVEFQVDKNRDYARKLI